jgi:hypothetical protein
MTMKKVFSNLYVVAAILVIAGAACKKDSNPVTPPSSYMGGDEVGRPAVATVFVATADKDNFNATIPSAMSAAYLAKIKAKLLALNPAYTTNALTLTADQFSGVLATDVLNVSATGTTTFFDGTNVLTGRALADDVIHTELLLIFGGPAGTSNPTLTDDHVPANDKAFLTSFPYEAAPW